MRCTIPCRIRSGRSDASLSRDPSSRMAASSRGRVRRGILVSGVPVLYEEADEVSRESHKELIEIIRTEDLRSDEFLLEIPADDVVDKDLLMDELPDIYDSLVFIKSSDAKRFIGRKELYDLAVEAVGRARVAEVERVNLQELRKALTAVEAARYTKAEPHESLTKVVRVAE